jgi:hypothetical protein
MLLSEHAGTGQFHTFADNWSDLRSPWNRVETKKYYDKIMVKWTISRQRHVKMVACDSHYAISSRSWKRGNAVFVLALP